MSNIRLISLFIFDNVCPVIKNGLSDKPEETIFEILHCFLRGIVITCLQIFLTSTTSSSVCQNLFHKLKLFHYSCSIFYEIVKSYVASGMKRKGRNDETIRIFMDSVEDYKEQNQKTKRQVYRFFQNPDRENWDLLTPCSLLPFL